MNEQKKIVNEKIQKLLKILVERNKKLEETNKKLEERDERLAEYKNVHEMKKKWDKELEEMNNKLEERDKQLAKICSKNPVSYTVSSINGKARQYRPNCMGEYYPTGECVNGFPVFRKGDRNIYVTTEGVWMIGYCYTLGSCDGEIVHPGIHPTPVTPPRNGWLVGTGNSWEEDTTLTVLPRSFITYRVLSRIKQLDFLLGDYMPTGRFRNRFQLFVKGQNSLFVNSNGYWGFSNVVSDGKRITFKEGYVYHPDKDPTPSTPPFVGWKSDDTEMSPSFTVIPTIGTYPIG